MGGPSETLHGTAVLLADSGVLLIGPSGSGKSSLAIELIGHGGQLIADDRVILTDTAQGLIAACPPTISGLIEARGVGVLNVPTASASPLKLVIDMGQVELERLPPQRNVTLVGHLLPLLWRPDSPHFAHMIIHLLTHGRSTR